MLIYHPAFDAYHCVFRMLAILEASPSIELDRARLLDFYLTFPSAISKIRLPNSLAHGRRLAKANGNAYRDPLNPRAVFRDMAQIQHAALRSIAALGIIDVKAYEQGVLQRAEEHVIPAELTQRIAIYHDVKPEVFSFLVKDLASIPLHGIDGLKHRTELLEYRYDLP
ncbi:ABC-three component system middle component 5 [Pseudomonas sp. Pseu.R1]|uniref:ABC-three component system middle component 5 n=1 Tax=Pseudomonas sp. Pseu.R1 TaxID=3379818 RepID=UPI003B945708